MLSRCARRLFVADVLAAISAGQHTDALAQLNALKRSRRREENVDYCRALCFMAGPRDMLQARQALLEELRHFPGNGTARALLLRVDRDARPLLLPPPDVSRAEPLFGLLCDALLDHTMLTWPRLYSLFCHARAACEREPGGSGVLAECGVAGGGSAVMLAVVAAHHCGGRRPRTVLAFDTFSGMPEPTVCDALAADGTPAEETPWAAGTCSSTEEHVRQLARNFSVDSQLVTVAGAFHQTMPAAIAEHGGDVAFLHVDADWYESTRSALELAWPHVQRGGIVQVDDYYYWAGCERAVNVFVEKEGLRLCPVDGNAVYFKKP